MSSSHFLLSSVIPTSSYFFHLKKVFYLYHFLHQLLPLFIPLYSKTLEWVIIRQDCQLICSHFIFLPLQTDVAMSPLKLLLLESSATTRLLSPRSLLSLIVPFAAFDWLFSSCLSTHSISSPDFWRWGKAWGTFLYPGILEWMKYLSNSREMMVVDPASIASSRSHGGTKAWSQRETFCHEREVQTKLVRSWDILLVNDLGELTLYLVEKWACAINKG